jgi:hypothetical protein
MSRQEAHLRSPVALAVSTAAPPSTTESLKPWPDSACCRRDTGSRLDWSWQGSSSNSSSSAIIETGRQRHPGVGMADLAMGGTRGGGGRAGPGRLTKAGIFNHPRKSLVWTGKIQGATCSSRSAFQALFRPVWAC